MSEFPDFIRVQITDAVTAAPLHNVVAWIKLLAEYKNDYIFILPVSDNNGVIEISKVWLRNKVKEEMSHFQMDFGSTLEHCKPKVELTIPSREEVARAAKSMKLYQEMYCFTQEEIDALSRVDNDKYLPTTIAVELHGEKVLNVRVPLEEVK